MNKTGTFGVLNAVEVEIYGSESEIKTHLEKIALKDL